MTPRPVGERIATVETTVIYIKECLETEVAERRSDTKTIMTKLDSIEKDRQRVLGMKDLVLTLITTSAAAIAVLSAMKTQLGTFLATMYP